MLEHEVIVVNSGGLHAQAASRLVELLSGFQSRITLECRGRAVNAKSIMGVMLLAATQGTRLRLKLDGPDQSEALQATLQLFASGFGEAADETAGGDASTDA